MLTQRNKMDGFGLIELMIAIALMGILLVMGAPAFSNWIQNAQVRTAAESISNGLQMARAAAVQRNTNVRFNLTSATGLVDWEICGTASTPCAAADIIQQRFNTDGSPNARVGVYEDGDGNNASNYATVIPAGNEMPSYVTFNGLGRVVTYGTDDTVRVDVTNAQSASARRMVITVSIPGGQVRMCDPGLPNTDPQGC